MSDGMRDTTPTRAAVLELKEERQVVREGYDFLDEKRLLLAAEILRQLRRYQELMSEFQGLHRRARVAFVDAIVHHGLQGLQVYPAEALDESKVQSAIRSFLGVKLVHGRLDCPASESSLHAVNPSPEARHCRRLFRDLIEQGTVVAGASSNLFRLVAEYRRTERRARALEDVILPELEDILRDMETHIEEVDQEEAIRTRMKYNG